MLWPSSWGLRCTLCSSAGRMSGCSGFRRLASVRGGAGADLPTYADVEAAAGRLRGAAHVTPAMTSHTVDEAMGASVFFKCENFPRMGAVKLRCARHAL